MPILSAENSFKKGLVALVDGDPDQALGFFRQALEIERQRNVRRPEWRYLSYYGLSLARTGRHGSEAIEACETAAEREALRADLFLNLGRVCAMAGKLEQARRAFQRGLTLDPACRALAAEIADFDRRLAAAPGSRLQVPPPRGGRRTNFRARVSL
jgi:tetratricopeptide (TPR) repeat protein